MFPCHPGGSKQALKLKKCNANHTNFALKLTMCQLNMFLQEWDV